MKKLLTDSLSSFLTRYFIYALFLVALTYLILWDASIERVNNSFSENSITEILQELFLFLIIVLFFQHAVTDKLSRIYSLIMADLFMCALIREFDSVMDNHIFDGAWQLSVTAICIAVTVLGIRHSSELIHTLHSVTMHRSFGIMASGILTVMVFSRLFGQQTLWMEIMGDVFMRSVKNAAEEGVELFGYYLCLVGTAEYCCETPVA